MESITTLAYWITGIGAVLGIVAYFILPGLIRKAFGSNDDKLED